MITKAEVLNKEGVVEELSLYNTVIADERLDEQLDTGSIQIITPTESVSFADFCPIRLTIEDLDGTTKEMFFCGFKIGEKRGATYYTHTLELVEPSRLLMGVIIEGKKVSQPIDGSKKKSLKEVLESLVLTFETLQANALGNPDDARFSIINSGKVAELLESTESPEFHWEAGTLLWECLCDIGNVINAIPRLTYSRRANWYEYNRITFDLINEATGEYDL